MTAVAPGDRAMGLHLAGAMAEEFVALPRSGDRMYGLLAGIYPTDHPVLPDSSTDQ